MDEKKYLEKIVRKAMFQKGVGVEFMEIEKVESGRFLGNWRVYAEFWFCGKHYSKAWFVCDGWGFKKGAKGLKRNIKKNYKRLCDGREKL